ncbi:cysteine hydrolase family protein [Alloalcanivorax xenomutans]|uniref:Cysteine hydrolase n=1 Tax=Alloalcanivorax xenomutans TaxID=1094342 RepID=A0A9Q3W5K0_9GAMM|nr:isochorismatase family cysteine hydrolase [Alloalcanivorax xenomutans]ARB47224.1 isochorismatase [Alloalcanivorax xenomutans]MCE7508227.1 cysteine hydrolase [Alloalcanivorax xenomutans]
MTQSDALHPLPAGRKPWNRWRVGDDHADLSRAGHRVRPLTIAARPKNLTLDVSRTALLVVDMQNDFCSAGGWLDHIGVDYRPARAPIEPLRAALPCLRRAGMPVVWVNWGNRPDLGNISPALLHVYNGSGSGVGLGDPVPATGAAVLQSGSWGAAVVDELAVDQADIQVAKFRMSGFWDTPLDSILRNLGINTCLFAGVNADQCVLHTLADANFLGYDTLFLEDCCATTSPAFCWDATLYNARQIFGFTALASDVCRALEETQP